MVQYFLTATTLAVSASADRVMWTVDYVNVHNLDAFIQSSFQEGVAPLAMDALTMKTIMKMDWSSQILLTLVGFAHV